MRERYIPHGYKCRTRLEGGVTHVRLLFEKILNLKDIIIKDIIYYDKNVKMTSSYASIWELIFLCSYLQVFERLSSLGIMCAA